MQSDPATECGPCLDFKTVREEYYPKWATPHDISLAELDGLSKKWEKGQRQICPFDWNQEVCRAGQYWNELSCKCHTMAKCKKMCPRGQLLSPLEMCECISDDELRESIYPADATDEEIRISEKDGFKNYDRW